jgi:hypothetical protein
MTTEEVIKPFPKIITESHTIVIFNRDNHEWLSWDIYTNNPLKVIGGGSSPNLEALLKTVTKEYGFCVEV